MVLTAPFSREEPVTRPPGRREFVVALLLLALIFTLSFSSSVRWIEGAIPYPIHMDEAFVAKPALRILQSGSLDPGFFRYPSLPIYLASIGMAVGSAIASANDELTSLSEIESVGQPYYSQPMVMRVPRLVQAGLAGGTLLLLAAIGYRMRRSAAMLVLGPAVLAVNGAYHRQGWQYLNVDLIASFFALAATLQILRAAEKPSFRALVIGPALLCGATIASKYPSGLILAPALAAVFWYAPEGCRARWAAALLFGAGATFVLCCPYSLLHFDVFVADVLSEVEHYASGHALHEGNRGLDQILYYGGHLVQFSGLPVVLLAGVGGAAAWRSDRRRVALLLLFPFLLLLVLAVQRVHFYRNLVPAYGMFAVAAGLGIHTVYGWLAARLRFLERPRLAGWAVTAILAVSLGASVPGRSLLLLRPSIDSRNETARWIEANLAPGSKLVVPSLLRLSGYGLRESFDLVRVRRPSDTLELAARDCYVLAPGFPATAREPQHRAHSARWKKWIARHSTGDPLIAFGHTSSHRAGPSTSWQGGDRRIRVLRCRPES